jgi:Ni/Co efflux regulator RcnB
MKYLKIMLVAVITAFTFASASAQDAGMQTRQGNYRHHHHRRWHHRRHMRHHNQQYNNNQ